MNSTRSSNSFWKWPSLDHIGRFLGYALIQSVWFAIIYGGANYLTSIRSTRVRVHFSFEEQLPFVPELIVIYSSMFLLMWAIPFVLRTAAEMRAMLLTMMTVTAVAGICFLLLPAELDFSLPEELGRFPLIFRISDWINLDYNQVPSLHVALGVVCAEAFRLRARTSGYPVLGWLFHLWMVGVAISAVLTFQHHIVDVVTGYGMALICVRYIYRRRLV